MRDDGRDLCILFAGCIEGHLGLRLRAEEARRSLHRILGPRNWNDATWELMLPSGTSLMFVEGGLADAAEALTRIDWRPLTPRLVVAALGISGQERARWTKDGRLPSSAEPRCGGQALAIPTYSFAVIERLLSSPDMLAAWRDQDAARQADTASP